MCGIAGYIGKEQGLPIVFDNLRKLEYRGYDSGGVVYFENVSGGKRQAPRLKSLKAVGKLDNLEKLLIKEKSLPEAAAIGHTRWATHGAPTENNAHPHADCKKEIFLVHNGIIENYQQLKADLIKKGHKFRSQTDTEVAVHLIEEYGFEPALKKIVGAYAFAVIFKSERQKIYIARLGSPLVVGVGESGFYVASDPTALAGLVNRVVYLKDGQRGVLSLSGMEIGPARPKIERLDIDAEQARKGNFPHFMLKEIFEGPEVVRAALRGRLQAKNGSVKLGGLEDIADRFRKMEKLDILACGTSYYSGLVGELLFEELAGIHGEAALASEYRYRKIPADRRAALFISQSGETADTLAALRKCNQHKFLTLGIVNAVGSSIARETFAGIYNHAGPEIGVASTKAFLSQLTVLTLMSLYANPAKKHKEIVRELAVVPVKMKSVLSQSGEIKKLAKKYQKYNNFLYIGRGYNYPTALEGALKLKEISYAHAEGYAGGEMKHGPIALIDKNFPTMAIATRNGLYDKMISNLEEIKARGGPILAIATQGDKDIKKVADDVIYVPATAEQLEPMVNVVPLQLFAYHFGVQRGYDVDKPRNLAKSVTVE